MITINPASTTLCVVLPDGNTKDADLFLNCDGQNHLHAYPFSSSFDLSPEHRAKLPTVKIPIPKLHTSKSPALDTPEIPQTLQPRLPKREVLKTYPEIFARDVFAFLEAFQATHYDDAEDWQLRGLLVEEGGGGGGEGGVEGGERGGDWKGERG